MYMCYHCQANVNESALVAKIGALGFCSRRCLGFFVELHQPIADRFGITVLRDETAALQASIGRTQEYVVER